MYKYIIKGLKLTILISCYVNSCFAVDVSNIDKQARQSQTRSVMFGNAPTRQENSTNQTQPKEEPTTSKPTAPIFTPYDYFGSGYKIVALINGEMISNKDLQERANLFALTTGIVINKENNQLVLEKVTQNVIDEIIKQQEAEKLKIRIHEKELEEAYRNFEKSNNLPQGEFEKVLKTYSVSKDIFLKQIESSLIWNKLLQQKIGRIDVSVNEVEAELIRIKKDMDTPKYMVLEIVISQKEGQHINELVEILQNNPKFELYANQFSQSPSAPAGGRLGWISKDQLDKPLNDAIMALKEGGVSKAISYKGDYYIFKLEKKYNPQTDKEKDPTDEDVRNYIRQKKSDEISNKYIRDLRNSAIVEKKF